MGTVFDSDVFEVDQLIKPMVNLYRISARGLPVAFVRQKRLALKEDIRFFADESEHEELFRIKARSLMELNARYDVTTPAGDGTELVISDTGIGMQEEEAARAHEPFVQFATTRDSLQGVGLGLSIVARLIKVNGARMSITSRKEHGTQVSIMLPAARDELERGVA